MSSKWPVRVIEEIEWIDSKTHGGWSSVKSYGKEKPIRCRTIGYVAKETKRHIVFLQNQCSNGQVSDSVTIPKSCIRSRRKIKFKE